MPNRLACILFALLAFQMPAGAQQPAQSPTPQPGQRPAPMRTSILESHEGLTIGVDPWTQASRYKEKFPKRSPFTGGIVAIRVTFHNDTNEGIKIDPSRIRLLVQLSEENRQELEPLTPEDVADTILLKNNGKDPTARRNPLPIPVGKPRPGRDANWTNFKTDCENAGLPSNIIGAHSNMEGLIYFDLRSEWELLQTARLYVPSMVTMQENRPLTYFDIALGRDTSH